MSGYWKVFIKSVAGEAQELPYFAWADNAQHALRIVEDFAGAFPPQRARMEEVSQRQLPDQAMVLGEPEEMATERNREEEM